MVVAVVRARWCGGGAGYGAQASTDRRTDAGTVPAASNCSDYSPGAGAEQAATDRALAGIVRVSEGRRRQHQSSTDHAGYSRLLSHSLPTNKPMARDRISVAGGRLASSPTKQTNDQGFGSVPWVATQLQSLLTLIRPAQAVTGFSAAFSARNSANTLLATIIDSRMIGTPT